MIIRFSAREDMMGQEDISDRRFTHLCESLQREYDSHWHMVSSRMELYRFYFGVVSAIFGLLVGLMAAGYTWSELWPSPGILAIFSFLFGMAVFLQLLNIDFHMTHCRRVTDELCQMILLEYSPATDSEGPGAQTISVPDQEPSYSPKALVERAMYQTGVKTQIVLINSAVGTAGIYYFVAYGLTANIWLISVSMAIAMVLIAGLHCLIASGRAHTSKGTLRYYGTQPPIHT